MRVIIVGGGIAGLTFASALEKAGIDFVLLEARSLFDPQVGASIAIAPSGMRIFDQLGAAQEVIDQTIPVQTTRILRNDGTLITKPSPSVQLIEKRFGYGTRFLDRQLVLRALDHTITSRDQMLLNKVVKSIEHDDSGATVHCEDGSSFRGDIVVGCDGVNSKASVRSEMVRIAGEVEPGFFSASEKTKMTAEFSCLFGISTGIEGLKERDVDTTYDVGRSFLVIGGKNGRIFWFFFQKLDKAYTFGAKDYPRYSKADAERVAEENAWRPCHEKLTLGDLWENRLSYTLVPMEEALFEHWSWGRLATIGDNAHKMTANHGQAGNNAIESATSLANHLKIIHDAGTVTPEAITTAFRSWRAKRRVRIEATVAQAAEICRMQSLDSFTAKATVFGILPYAEEYVASLIVDVLIGAEVLEFLPIPRKSLIGSCPFNPTYGVGQHESMLKRAVLAAPLLLLSYFIASKTSLQGVEDSMLSLVQPAGASHGEWVQAFSSLVDAGLIYSLWLIESNRRANALTIIQVPLLFGILNHIFGPGVVAPCFYFVHYTLGRLEKFACSDMRLTDIAYTRTVVPVVLLGVLAPLLLRLTGTTIDVSASQWHFIWMLLPPLAISISQWLLVKTGVSKGNVFQDALTNWTRDLPAIRCSVYVLSAISGAVRMYGLSQGSISKGFELETSLQWNSFGMLLSSAVWLGLLFVDLNRAGMAGSSEEAKMAKGLAINIVGGPAASIALCWLWREEILASKREKHAITGQKYAGKSINEVEGRQQPAHAQQNGHTKREKHAITGRKYIGKSIYG